MTDRALSFPERIRGVFGARGEDWLAALPETIASVAARWSLDMHEPFTNLTYNYVAPATRTNGAPVVLKLGVPNPEMRSEIAALRCFDGRGAVRLLAADAELGALLLERLLPGESLLHNPDDERATAIAARVMQALWRPAPAEHNFPTVAGWGEGFRRVRARFDGGSGPLPAESFARGEALYRDLVRSSAAPVLLHGDLHHDNILAAGAGRWLAIDPKGVIGEPAFETASLLFNPHGLASWPNLDARLARRVHILADALGFEPERLRAWAEAKCVLSACWTVEDHGVGWPPAPALAMAERFAALNL